MLLLKKEMHERTLKQSFDSELFILNSEQWILMNHLCCILKPFELVTREISSANASLIRDLSLIQILNLKLRRIKPSFWKDQEYFGKQTGQTGGFLDGAISRVCAGSDFQDWMFKIRVWKRVGKGSYKMVCTACIWGLLGQYFHSTVCSKTRLWRSSWLWWQSFGCGQNTGLTFRNLFYIQA